MSDLYEIVETSSGEIILRRADENAGDSPLLSITFSEEALYFLSGSKFFVAKAMIEAGLEAASEQMEERDQEEFYEIPEDRLLH